MSVSIPVTGIPPKKRSDTSLWNCESEVPKVIALRREARTRFGDRKPFTSRIRLRLSVFLTASEFSSTQVGDLDNFVSGVCDALQAADPKASLDERFRLTENEDVNPSKAIVIQNDRDVISIVADKFLASQGEPLHYTVVLDGD